MEVYGEHAPAERTCQKWFARTKSGHFVLEDEERPGQPKKFESLGVTQAAISKRLKAAGYIQKQGNWVPHELNPRDVERRFCMSEMLLGRHKKKSFLHQIVTGDEKWIHYDNPKRKNSYVKSSQPAKSTAKSNIHGAKVILCIWWDQKGVLYYELLKPGETINGPRVLEGMYCVWLGNVKKILDANIGGKFGFRRLNKRKLEILDSRMIMLQSCYPSEFNRQPQKTLIIII